MRRFVVTARLREGSTEQVARLLREEPPFDIAGTSLERHDVYLSEGEVVFLFEGADAGVEAARLMASDPVVARLDCLGVHIDGEPALAPEVFSWERPSQLDGVTFGPLPGPGDSEGGPAA